MPTDGDIRFYAVKRGRQPGVYITQEECRGQIRGFPAAVHKGFPTLEEAERFIGVTPIETSLSKVIIQLILSTSQRPTTPLSDSSATSSSTVKPTTSKPKPLAVEEPAPKPLQRTKTKRVEVYTDGACSGNGTDGAVAGIGVWYGHNDDRNLSERCPGTGRQTNQQAELIAIIRCLETDVDPEQPLLIKTDSKYSIDCVTNWLSNWVRNGWKNSKGQPVQNKEIIQHLLRLKDERPGKVDFAHVRGHSGIEGNEGADRLALEGAKKPALPDRKWNTGDGTFKPIATGSHQQIDDLDPDWFLSAEAADEEVQHASQH